DWAALFDGRDHFTVLLTAEVVRHLRGANPVGQVLRALHSWATAQSDFRAAKVHPGDHVYPVQLADGRLHVLTRLRVARLRSRTWRFTENEFLPRTVRGRIGWVVPSDIQILDVADGGRLDYDRALPHPVFERLRYATRRGERGL